MRFSRPLLLSMLILGCASAHAGEHFTRTQLLMGNVPVSIEIDASPRMKEKAYAAMEKAFAEAKRIENRVSEWREGSEATLMNRHPGTWVPIGRDLMQILLLSERVSEWTDGAFDITFSSPNRTATFRDVELIPELSLARLDRRGVKVGVSGIAKGTIVDRMSDLLRKDGFRDFLVNAGDLFASGPWEVEIRDPDHPARSICRLKVKDLAVSTSGLYERGPHIIDPRSPRSQRPVSPLKSISVIAGESALADALATGAFVLGRDHLEGIAGKVSGIVFIDSGGEIGTVGRVSARCRDRFN